MTWSSFGTAHLVAPTHVVRALLTPDVSALSLITGSEDTYTAVLSGTEDTFIAVLARDCCGKCKWGVVIKPGVLCGGMMLNIAIAADTGYWCSGQRTGSNNTTYIVVLPDRKDA